MPAPHPGHSRRSRDRENVWMLPGSGSIRGEMASPGRMRRSAKRGGESHKPWHCGHPKASFRPGERSASSLLHPGQRGGTRVRGVPEGRKEVKNLTSVSMSLTSFPSSYLFPASFAPYQGMVSAWVSLRGPEAAGAPPGLRTSLPVSPVLREGFCGKYISAGSVVK